MFSKFDGCDVVREVHHQARIGVVGASQVEGVGNAQRLFLDDVVNAFSRQALANVFCDLANELVRDDGDVFDPCPADRAQCIVNDRSFVQRKQRFLCVAGEREKTRAIAARNEDGLDRHALHGHEAALEDAHWESLPPFDFINSSTAPSLAFRSNQPVATKSPKRLTPSSMLSMSRASAMSQRR